MKLVQKLISKYKIVILILLLLGITLISKLLSLNFKIEALRDYFTLLGPAASILYILLFSLGEIIPLASSVNSLLFYAAGLIFKPEQAIVYTLAADMIGITVNFLIARYFGLKLLGKILNNKQVDYLKNLTKDFDWELIFLFRLVPFVTTLGVDIVSYAAGISKISWIKLVLATLIPWLIIDIIQFYSINYFANSLNAFFLLPVYLILAIPAAIILLRRKPKYQVFFQQFIQKVKGVFRV